MRVVILSYLKSYRPVGVIILLNSRARYLGHVTKNRDGSIGLCFNPHNNIVRTIVLILLYLNVLIHEMLHIYNPTWPETRIDQTANEMASIIWSKNYRRMKR